jgi:hypothetical protein
LAFDNQSGQKTVAVNWKSISTDHVRESIRRVAAESKKDRESGLVILANQRVLSAKEVLRMAYRIANNLPEDAPIKFSSGEGTLSVLRELGFSVERRAAPAGSASRAQ